MAWEEGDTDVHFKVFQAESVWSVWGQAHTLYTGLWVGTERGNSHDACMHSGTTQLHLQTDEPPPLVGHGVVLLVGGKTGSIAIWLVLFLT